MVKVKDYSTYNRIVHLTASALVCGLSLSLIICEKWDTATTYIQSELAYPTQIDTVSLPVLQAYDNLAKLDLRIPQQSKIETDTAASVFSVPEVVNISLQAVDSQPIIEPIVKQKTKKQKKVLQKQIEKTAAAISEIRQELVTELKKEVPKIKENTEEPTQLINNAAAIAVNTLAPVPVPTNKKVENPALIVSDRVNQKHSAIDENFLGKLEGSENFFSEGHFEVGFYENIDITGDPVGFPKTSTILEKGQRDFEIKLLPNSRGYIFARYFKNRETQGAAWYAYPGNPIKADAMASRTVVIPISDQNKNKYVARNFSVAAKQTLTISGQVQAMSTKKGKTFAMEAVNVKIRGTNYVTKTDKTGAFSLEVQPTRGDVFLEFTKAGYLPQLKRISIKKNQNVEPTKIEMVNRESITNLANTVGKNNHENSSIMIVHSSVSGTSFRLSLNSDEPVYFSDDGYPNADLKNTGSDGRAIFFNIEPGVGLLESSVAGEPITPVVVSPMNNGEVVVQDIEPIVAKIQGTLLSPLAADGKLTAIAGARVQVEGSGYWTNTDSNGNFTLPDVRFSKNSEIMLEIDKEDYFRHRYVLTVPERGIANLKLFAFPRNYLKGLAASVDVTINPFTGIFIGSVGTNPGIRIDALADHSDQNEAHDFYFDEKQNVVGSYAFTNKKYGTFIIFNVPTGRILLQGLDKQAILRWSSISYGEQSTVNVILPQKD